MPYDIKIRTCIHVRKFLSERLNIPLKDITANKAATKIIITVKVGENQKAFFFDDAPFIYCVPDERWEKLVNEIQAEIPFIFVGLQ